MTPDGVGARAGARRPRASAGVLVRALIAHAIAATPRGARGDRDACKRAGARRRTTGSGARIVVDDGGTIAPRGGARALLALEVEPGTFGRPSGVALFVAAEIAAAQGALLEIGDAPVVDGRGGGRSRHRHLSPLTRVRR